MDAYQQLNTDYWNLADSYSADFPHFPDDDFLSMLQKEFPDAHSGLNTHTFTPFASSSSLSPPSDYSSPSPPNVNQDVNNRGRPAPSENDDSDPAPKRKASNEEIQGGPSSKTQHTSDPSAGKKTNTRRKPATQDETRLLKRKEQNRAAQRAFRERKEKHVKDLEEQIAALQAQNEEANTENENLRDLLSRLQRENAALQQAPFTFAVPKNAASNNGSSSLDALGSTQSQPSVDVAGSFPSSFPLSLPDGEIDWSSLHVLDPTFADLLDENLQPTATEGASQMDFGFGYASAPTTIASNPQYMSLADTFETPVNPAASDSTSDGDAFNFDLNYMPSWPVSLPELDDPDALRELLNSGFLNSQHSSDLNTYAKTPSQSPVQRTAVPSVTPSLTSSSSLSSNPSLFNTPRESTASIPEDHDEKDCPKSREHLLRVIAASGPSAFVENSAPFAENSSPFVEKPSPFAEKSHVPMLRKTFDPKLGSAVVGCGGAKFPPTVQSDKNVEVIAAWKRITSDPNFKEADITELCTEFSNKARCDGEKVVLEPQGVKHIIDSLAQKKNKRNA